MNAPHKHTVTVRASSWGDLFDCAYRWEGVYLLGMRKAASGAAHLGTALHASTAVYDAGRIDKRNVTVDDAAGVFVDTLQHPERDVDWSDVTKKDAQRIGLQLHTRYCNDWSPHYTFKAVEMQLKPLDVDTGKMILRLTGTMDRARVRVESSRIGITDLKSGKRAVDDEGRAVTKGHAPQIGVYEILYEHTTGEKITAPGAIIGLKTSSQPVIGHGEIVDARTRLIGDLRNPGLMDMAVNMFTSGMFPPNPRSQLCSERYCARWKTCTFHD